MSRRIDVAPAPLPTTMSSRKSSMAVYRISSTARGIRWISSMNMTSPASRFERIEARSPARSSTGPEVDRSSADMALARMAARVVLPSPGGPLSRTWSIGSPRPRAASTRIEIRSFRSSWPTNSPRVSGRRPASNAASSGPGRAASSPSSLMPSPVSVGPSAALLRHRRRAIPQRHPESRSIRSRGLPAHPGPPRPGCRREGPHRGGRDGGEAR